MGSPHKLRIFLNSVIPQSKPAVSHEFEYALWAFTIAVLVVTGFLTYRFYARGKEEKESESSNALSRLLENKYYLDEIYDFLFVNPLKKLGTQFMNLFEYKIIDKIVWFPVHLVQSCSSALRPIQNGSLSWYLLYSVLGLLITLILFLII